MKDKGFTIIELLVVILMIGVLSAMVASEPA
ncbi:MAG: type II secretion system protein [Nostoc sp.]